MWIVCYLVANLCPTLLRCHEPEPSRLLCSWNFSGKNTRVGSHFILQGSSKPKDQTHISCTGRLAVRFVDIYRLLCIFVWDHKASKLTWEWGWHCTSLGNQCRESHRNDFRTDSCGRLKKAVLSRRRIWAPMQSQWPYQLISSESPG